MKTNDELDLIACSIYWQMEHGQIEAARQALKKMEREARSEIVKKVVEGREPETSTES